MKTLRICAKVSDTGWYGVEDENGNLVAETDGGDYVPNFIPGEHWGDYIELDIDIETGQVLNWNVDKNVLRSWVRKHKVSN